MIALGHESASEEAKTIKELGYSPGDWIFTRAAVWVPWDQDSDELEQGTAVHFLVENFVPGRFLDCKCTELRLVSPTACT
jgi:hypothetical protein